MTGRGRRRLRLALAVGGLLLFARLFVVEVHEIEGTSMWPAVNAGSEGEVILVLKWGEPQRYDPWIVRDPNGASVLKRIVGLPEERVLVSDGDLLIDSAPAPRRLADILATRVPILGLGDLRYRESIGGCVTVDGLGRSVIEALEGAFALADDRSALELVPPADGRARIRLPAAGCRDDHAGVDGRLLAGENPVRDLIVTLGVRRLEVGSELTLRYAAGDGDPEAPVLQVQASTGGLDLQTTGQSTLNLPGRRAPFRLRWTRVEGRRYLQVSSDDRDGDDWVDLSDLVDRPAAPGTPVRLELEARGEAVVLSLLDIDRDLHYTPQPVDGHGVREPLPLGPGQFFALGDNSPVSRDSRDFGPIERPDLVGRPWLRLWPLSRLFTRP